MTATDHRTDVLIRRITDDVPIDELVCNGCGDRVRPDPPLGWPAAAGAAPEFSHGDGSVLCPDEHGRIGEPIEIHRGLFNRYVLTESGRAALYAEERS